MASAKDASGEGSTQGGDNPEQASGGVLGTVTDKLSSLVGGGKEGDKGEGYVDQGEFDWRHLGS